MAFDKAAFRESVVANFTVAANPTFTPVPDEGIVDEALRAAAHATAMERWAAARQAAIADVAAHASAQLVAERVAELWPTEAKADELLAQAQAAIADGSGESLGDAAALLSIVGFLKLTTTVKE